METRKFRTGQIRQMGDERTVRFTLSDESKDRHNSVVLTDAWNLENFRENPIAGWGHAVYGGWRAPDPDDIIGSWDVWVEGNELIGDLTFEDAETNPKADKLFRKVKNGTLNAVSVGFLPHKAHEGDPEEREGEEAGVTYYDEAELVEASLVVIPSNPNARKKAFDDIPELVDDFEELINSALSDKLEKDEIERLTLKGLFTILRGGDAEEVMGADFEEYVDNTQDIDVDELARELERDNTAYIQEHYKRLSELL